MRTPAHDPVSTSKVASTRPPPDRSRLEPGADRDVLRLQRLAGNQAVTSAVQARRRDGSTVAVQRKPKLVTIGQDQVKVADDKEEAEAKAILARIQAAYKVELSSQDTIEGIKSGYKNVGAKVVDKLAARPWRVKELRALETALAFYKPILGDARASSTRASQSQEVATVGKLEHAINENTKNGKLDNTTLGEYFQVKKNMGLFKNAEGNKEDFPTERQQLVGTFVHEMAHGLLAYALSDFIKATGYWKSRSEELAKKDRTEGPPSSYGKTNAAEDLCETAMFYFVDPKRLKKHPKRVAFMQQVGNAWIPPPQVTPMVQPTVPSPTAVDAVTSDEPQLPQPLLEVLEVTKDSAEEQSGAAHDPQSVTV